MRIPLALFLLLTTLSWAQGSPEERYVRYRNRLNHYRAISEEEPYYDDYIEPYERRARQEAIHMRQQDNERPRDLDWHLREERELNRLEREARVERVQTMRKQTTRNRMLQRQTERSWHDLPHSMPSSPVKRSQLDPYQQDPRFHRQYP
jgi:hypothetical protein